MQKFKVGDRVRQTEESLAKDNNLVDHWNEWWKVNVGPTDGTFYVTGYPPLNETIVIYSSVKAGDGPTGGFSEDNFELVEEPEMQKIEVGSKWVSNSWKNGLIVTVVHVTEKHVAYEFSDGIIGVDTPENFANHTPYQEPKTVVGYVAVLKDVESGELMFEQNVQDTEEDIKSVFENYYCGNYEPVKIIKVEYVEEE